MIRVRSSVLALAGFPALLAAAPGAPAEMPVRAWEAPLALPTYPLGAPEPNPMFYAGREYQGARGPVYPYPLQDQLSQQRDERRYRALWLENEYVRISVLPELGGRIFSAQDRTNGYHFFYRQSVVKPALVGMLGAWISGGVEWNVFHHHRPSSFMPVQGALVENEDGSATIWVGETERRQRMRWVIALTLRPGRSSVEASVRMLNRTPLPHSILYFANPAVHANDSYQVLFPPDVEWATSHAKVDFSPWPLARGPFVGRDYAPGTDLSWWRNHRWPVSFFVYRSGLDFLGGYDHARRAGVAHVADRHTSPGKKLWEWGNGPDGRMWDRILTDADGPYIELMTGGFSDNQPDYSWISPGEAKALVETWYPIRELGGLAAATLQGALHLELADGKLRLAANATAAQPAARVALTAAGHTLLDETVRLAPDEPFVREVRVPAGVRAQDLRAAVTGPDGRELVAYQPRPRAGAPEPARYAPPPPPSRVASVEELVLAGQRLEQFHSARLEAEPYYREALRRDAGESRAHTALGILLLRRGGFEEAERHLARAVARVTANHTRARSGEASYHHGLALAFLGRDAAAREAFAAAAWDMAFTAAARLELGRLESARGEPGLALAAVEAAVRANPGDTAALALQAALLRRAGRPGAAARAATAGLALDPLDPLLARELALARETAAAEVAPPAATEQAALASLGEDSYALEAAHDYGRAGLLEDAIAVLQARLPQADSSADPLVAYTLGWLQERKGDADAAARSYRRGQELAPEYCFPYRLEEIGALERAMAAQPRDPRAPYYLGNLLYDLQPERAIALWERSRGLDPGFARVHRNLAFAYARTRGELVKAVASQEQAVALETREPRLYYELDQLYAWARAPLARRLQALSASPATVASREITAGRLARVQLLLGREDDALRTLAGTHFHVWEGESGIHAVYVAARLERGRRRLAAGDAAGAAEEFRAAIKVPDAIEVGQGVGSHLAAVHHHVGLALQALADTEAADAAFREAADVPGTLPEGRYWIGRSLEALGRTAEARGHFEALAAIRPVAVDPARALEPRMEQREARSADFHARALGLLGLGRRAEARAALATSLELDPDNIPAVLLSRTLPPRAPAAAGPPGP